MRDNYAWKLLLGVPASEDELSVAVTFSLLVLFCVIIQKGFMSLFGLSHRKGLIMKMALWVYLDYHKEKD